MAAGRIPGSLTLLFAAVGLPIVVVSGLWIFATATATIYPNPESVPAVIDAAPLPKWASAVEQSRRIVRAGVAGQNLPGLSVAVGINGSLIWAEGFGFADLRTGAPVTPRHRFRIGAASAALTSAAAGLLLEDGRLTLAGEIQNYVPAFPGKSWPVTLRELMGDTAGVISADLFTRHCERPVEALQYFAADSLLFQPGTQYRYSSGNWILVSAAIEAAAEQPFLTFMRERIFDPLGMHDTVPDPAPREPDDDFPLFNLIRERIFDPRTRRETPTTHSTPPGADRVTSYLPRFASDPGYGLHLMRSVDYSCYAGAGVFDATPSDLVRFGMAMNGGRLLQPATVQLLQTSQRLASGEETGHGLGWYIRTVTLAGKQTRVIGQDGDSPGGRVASLVTFPEYGIVAAVASNIAPADTFSLAVQIAAAMASAQSR